MSFGEGAGSPMLLNAYVGAQQDERVIKIVEESLMEFSQLQIMRNVFASQWEEIAELIFPTSRNTFNYGSYNFPGQKKTDRQIDATGMVALDRFAAICDSLLTPRNMTWHGLGTTDPYLNKQRAVRLYYQEVTRRLFMGIFRDKIWCLINSSGHSELQACSLTGMRIRSVALGLAYATSPFRLVSCFYGKITKEWFTVSFVGFALPRTRRQPSGGLISFPPLFVLLLRKRARCRLTLYTGSCQERTINPTG